MRDATKTLYWFKHPRSMTNGKIWCQSNPTGTKGTDFSLTSTLFVDDTAIVANTYEELVERGKELVEKGKELFNHFRKFGLGYSCM
jgi:hypothetical protein